MDLNQTNLAKLLGRTQDAIDRLLRSIPAIHGAVRAADRFDLDHDPGWRTISAMPRRVIEASGRPVLVAVLVGPSGAGKSTFFKMLTGVEVPAGDAVRPMTFGTVAALDESAWNAIDKAALFPGYTDFNRMESPDQLKDRDSPPNTLFYTTPRNPLPATGYWPCIVDAPDFNCVEKSNWEKAERMMARADLVIFLVYHEGYKDYRNVEMLARCCRQAGELAYVITKVSEKPAQQIWRDLLDEAGRNPAFEVKRHDGRSLAEFLAQSAAFYSPYGHPPRLEECQSITEPRRGLRELVAGAEGARILVAARLQSLQQGLETVRRTIDVAQQRIDALRDQLGRAEESIGEEARHIAGSHFPLGRMLDLIIETARSTRPRIVNWITAPITLMANLGLRSARGVRALVNTFGRVSRNSDELVARERLEHRRRTLAAERLIDRWRSLFTDETAGLLSTDRYRGVLAELEKQDLPTPGRDWEEFVRAQVREWARAHPLRTMVIGTLNDLLFLIGGSTVVIDYFVTGGMGTLGMAAWVGGGSVLAGTLLKIVEELGLWNQFRGADEEWQKIRKVELTAHLRQGLADPLFLKAWQDELADIERSSLAEARKDYEYLVSLSGESKHD